MLLSDPSLSGHLGCLYLLAPVNTAAMNTFKIPLVLKFSFIMCIARGGVAGLYICIISRGRVEILSHAKVTAGPWVSSSFTLPHIALSQDLSLNQNSPLWPDWL